MRKQGPTQNSTPMSQNRDTNVMLTVAWKPTGVCKIVNLKNLIFFSVKGGFITHALWEHTTTFFFQLTAKTQIRLYFVLFKVLQTQTSICDAQSDILCC